MLSNTTLERVSFFRRIEFCSLGSFFSRKRILISLIVFASVTNHNLSMFAVLSANGETQTVMKGIAHGACDYLLKPVRIEELKNIWQHVIRRKKFDARDQNNLDAAEDCDKYQLANSEGAQGLIANGSSDRNGKLNRKRKDQNEDDEDDGEENLNENEDLSTQKKPRVVWSVELHRKFVAAVNQLGIDSKNCTHIMFIYYEGKDSLLP